MHPHRATLRIALFLGLAVMASRPLPGAEPDIIVRKTPGEGDPTLAIAGFDGPAEMAQTFRNVLSRCGWFQVVDSGAAAIRVEGRYVAGGNPTVDIRYSRGSGAPATVRGAGAAADSPDMAVYRAVDALIEAIHGSPGPCSTRIAFALGGKDNLKEIYTCRFDGTDVTRLTRNNSISTEPSWGAGGRSMVYTLYHNNATSVILVDLERNRQRRLSHFPGLNSGAALSPDGRFAALSLSRDRRIELYLIAVESGQIKRLTEDLAVESSPCWSPDGRSLAFVSDRGGRPRIYVMGVGGGTAAPLVRERDEGVSPDWSPVSNKVCYSTRVDGRYSIAVVDMGKGSARKREIITRAAGDWEAPSWAPDGRHIVCTRRTQGNSVLYMIDSQGKTPATQITSSSHNATLPNWAGR